MGFPGFFEMVLGTLAGGAHGVFRFALQAVDLPELPEAVDEPRKTREVSSNPRVSLAFPSPRPQPPGKRSPAPLRPAFSSAPWKTGPRTPPPPVFHRSTAVTAASGAEREGLAGPRAERRCG